MSRVRPRASQNSETAKALLKLLVFTLLVPCTVTVWLPFYYLYPGVRSHFPDVGLSAVAGIIFIALGAMGYLWCALDFVFVGKGTPTPIDQIGRAHV